MPRSALRHVLSLRIKGRVNLTVGQDLAPQPPLQSFTTCPISQFILCFAVHIGFFHAVIRCGATRLPVILCAFAASDNVSSLVSLFRLVHAIYSRRITLRQKAKFLFECDMDPIIASTTVLSVIGTAIKVGRETYILVQGARTAPAHIQRLATEMQGL